MPLFVLEAAAIEAHSANLFSDHLGLQHLEGHNQVHQEGQVVQCYHLLNHYLEEVVPYSYYHI